MKNKSLFISRKNSNRLYVLLGIVTLLCGGMVYILFRSANTLFITWLRKAGLDPLINWLKHGSFLSDLHLPNWAIYSLPNALWAFSYTLLICMIWSGRKTWLKYFWLTSAPILVFAVEVLQYFKLIPGTFCILDLVLGSLGLVAGFLLGTLKKQ